MLAKEDSTESMRFGIETSTSWQCITNINAKLEK